MSTNVAKGRFSPLFVALAIAGLTALSAPAHAEDAKPISVKTVSIKPDSEAGSAKANEKPADDARQQFVTRMFGGPISKPKHYACFTRTYDADHLARHKLQ